MSLSIQELIDIQIRDKMQWVFQFYLFWFQTSQSSFNEMTKV